MNQDDCIFCKIALGIIPCAKIWENEKYLAFLDINPNTKGMALVITKDHYDSYIFDLTENVMHEAYDAAKIVSKKINNYFGDHRVGVVAEGMGVNHFHLKIYPMHGVGEEYKPDVSPEKVFFDKYPGFITTKVGDGANLEELNKMAEEIFNTRTN